VTLTAKVLPVAELWGMFTTFHKSFNPGIVRMPEPIKGANTVDECVAALIKYESYLVTSGVMTEQWLTQRGAWIKRMQLAPHPAYQVASGLLTLHFGVASAGAFRTAEWASPAGFTVWRKGLLKADVDSPWTLVSKAVSNSWTDCWALFAQLLALLVPSTLPADRR